MFCVYCWKNTESKNEKWEDLKEYKILKGECKECNKINLVKKEYKRKLNNETKVLLI